MAGKKTGSVDVQHFGWGLSTDKQPDRTLISEFGLSMHAQSQSGSETRNLLMDFGFTGEALKNNLDLLGNDPAALDALVLSHGHYDHFGGLVGFLREYNGKLNPSCHFTLVERSASAHANGPGPLYRAISAYLIAEHWNTAI